MNWNCHPCPCPADIGHWTECPRPPPGEVSLDPPSTGLSFCMVTAFDLDLALEPGSRCAPSSLSPVASPRPALLWLLSPLGRSPCAASWSRRRRVISAAPGAFGCILSCHSLIHLVVERLGDVVELGIVHAGKGSLHVASKPANSVPRHSWLAPRGRIRWVATNIVVPGTDSWPCSPH